jgi:hypothetical protein
VHYDRSISIREAIDDVQFTLILAGFLVILVILLFLRNLSATVIPALALPISVIGTFAAMQALGLQPRQSLAAGTDLCVGFVVDDAIVMLENIVRHVENGKTPIRGRDQGRARDRLHDHFDDHLADRRFHSRALHERHRRPPAARIRRHHLRRHPGLGFRVADPDADALQPLPQSTPSRLRTAASSRPSSAFLTPCSGLRAHAQAGDGAPAHGAAFLSSPPCAHRISVIQPFPRTSCRAATRARSSPHRGRAGHLLRLDGQASARVAEIVAQEPDIRSFMSAVGAGGIRPTANTGTSS